MAELEIICKGLKYVAGKWRCNFKEYECEFKRDGKYCRKPTFYMELRKIQRDLSDNELQ